MSELKPSAWLIHDSRHVTGVTTNKDHAKDWIDANRATPLYTADQLYTDHVQSAAVTLALVAATAGAIIGFFVGWLV